MARSGDYVVGDTQGRAHRLTWRRLVAAVVAVLLAGMGLSAEGALAQSSAGPPAISEIIEGSGEVTLSWTAPTSLPSGHTVVAYDLRHIEHSETNRADSNWTVVDNFWVSSPPVPLTGVASSLVNGTEYDFEIRAVTSDDGGVTSVDGSWSGIGSATARNSAPVIESQAGDEAATVAWSAPSEIAADSEATYDVRWIISSATNKSDGQWTVVSGLGGDPAYHILRNLTNGTSYDVQVRVVSGHNGSWSTTSPVTPYEPGTGKPSTQSSIKIGVPIAAEFGTNTDVDVFKIVTTGPTNLVIYTTAERSAAGEAVAGEVDDTVCTLRSDANVSDGSDVLATNDNSYLQPLDSHCALAATVDAGTYYLEVRAFRQNGISAASKDVGNYVLHSSNQPAAGSSTTTATPFPPGEILSGTHTSADDVHYFRIDADEAEHIQVDVVWPVANNIITLHDADDAPESPFVTHELQCVVDNCFSLISTLTARVEAGVHYIRLQPPVDLAEGSDSRYYLKRGPDVAYSEFVTFCTGQPRHATLSDPLSGCQWHLNNSGQLGGTVGEDANVAAAHAAGYLGTGINVSVVDHGFDINHVDLTNDPPLSSTTFTACDREGEDVNDALVPFSSITDHGTQVAGVVGARANSIGMRGVAPGVTLYNYRLIHDTCVTTNGNIIEAMTQDRDLIAVSVNSWGGTDGRDASPTSSLFDRAIDTGLASGFGGKGTVYVWAGGNGGDIDDSNLDEYNNYYGVVAVCAVDDDGVRAAYSEKGENLWVCAPSSGGDGAGVATLTHYDRYLRDSGGTSAAAPIVAGVVAQMRAVKAALTWRDVKLILAASARRNDTNDTAGWSEGELRYRPDTDTDRYWFNKKYGFGVVDSLAAVEMAKNWTLLPEMITKDVDSTDRSFTIPDTKAVVTKTVRFDNAIDFVEYVQLDTDIAALSFRSLRIELVSPSGTVSVMSPELSEANTEHLTALQEAFRFGSSRHLGERAEGEWTLRVSDQDSGTPLNEDGAAELATVTSWGVKLFGHRLRPSAPQSVAVTTGPGTVTASWAAPEHNGAEAVNGYELAHIASAATARDDDNWTTVDIAAGTLTGTVTVSEETDVRVRATNSQADGEWSETITVTPRTEAEGVTVSPGSVSVSEGGADGSYTVALATQPMGDVTVTPTSTNPAAVTVSPVLTFTTGDWSTAQTVTVTAVQDANASDEEVVVSHMAASTADSAYNNLAGATVTVTVTDDDDVAVVVSFGQAAYSVAEGDKVSVTVNLSPAPERVVAVPITATGTGADVGDYSGVPTSLSFAADETSKTITFAATQDMVDDDGESVRLAFGSPPAGVTVGSPAATVVTIVDDDDVAVTVFFGQAAYSVAEGDTVSVTVNLSAAPGRVVVVPMTATGTGAGPSDYSGVFAYLSFAADETSKTIMFAATQDMVDDDGESVRLGFGTPLPTGVTAGLVTVTVVTIVDDDDVAVTVFFGQAAYSVAEGDTVSVTVNLSAAPGRVVAVPITATGTGADTGDYSGVPTSLSFAADETSKTITFAATQDMVDDDGESVHLAFGSPPAGVTVGSPAATVVTIDDDETAGVTVSQGAVSVSEGGADGSYTVVLATQPMGAVTVTIVNPDTDAVTVSPTSLTFTTGNWATAQTVTVSAEQDSNADDESVDVSHTTVSADLAYNNLGVDEVTVTVTDDDANAEPTFDVNVASREVAENTVSGGLGAAITATDVDVGDVLVYSVAATTDSDAADNLLDFNRDFVVDAASGQISVNATAEINFEDRSTYTVLFQVSDGKDDSGVAETGTLTIDATLTLTVTVTDVNEAGVVTIGGTPQVGEELTATLTDLDGATSDVAWQWSRGDSPSGTFTDIADATEATYTPVDADAGMYLRATATYRDDTHDADGEMAAGTAAAAVTSAPRFALDLGRLQVDSTGMASTDSIDRETESLVQAFTTGGKPSDEFVLRRVRLYTAVASGQSINEVAVWSNDPNVFRMSDGVPLAALADGVLSGPDSFDDDLASAEVFESASGVRLAGGTKYWLVVSKQEKADLRIRIPYLAASGVVTDSQTGWSLGQTAFDNENSQPWEYITGIHPWRMQIVTFPARSVPENAASGDAVVGGAITTTDADGDTLTYSVVATDASDGGADLTAFNRDFALNTGTGLISVKATGAMIDYETRSSYTVLYQVSDSENASGTADTTVDDTVTVTVTVTNVDEPGVVTFDGMPQVDVVLTATLTDPDGSVSAEAWSWSKSATAGGTFTTIGGATDASYTPAAADVGMFLKAAVSYTDGFGSSRSAETTATSAVLAAAVVHTVPVFPDSDSNGTADPVVRSVAENTASGVVGAAITATDGDGDTLTYSVAATADGDAAAHLTAFNQHFDLDDGSGQISVKAGAVINFEARESYKVLYRVSDGEDASGAADAVIDDMLTLTVTVTNVDEPGVVTIGGTPQVDVVSTATLTDPDGSVSAEMWSWSKSATAGGTFTTIGGATDASYTPAAADVGMFLKAAVTYTDNVHSATGQTASGTTTSAVPHTAPRFALDLGRLQVDSTGMASTDSIDRETESLVQAFTTGGKPSDEFVLRRVRLYTAVASGQSINEVAVWSNDPNVFRMSDGVPLVALADGVLSGPDSFDDDLASAEVFESASGVRLAGGTKYWLVVSKQEKADLRIRIPYLAASGVVTDSQTGWSLGQTAFDNENSQPWEYISGIHPWRMQIVTFPARSVPENAASGDAVVGGAITTTDADGDTLTYSVVATDASDGGADLTAFNRDFALNTGTGLISVKATGAMIDYETRSSYTVLYQVSDGENASGTADTTVDDTVTVTVTVTNVDEPGVVTFDGMPQVDVVLTATLTDPDGSVSAEMWSWSKSATAGGTFTTIGGATDASYTPAAADVGMFLKAAVSYTDGFGSSRSAETTATSAVLAAAVVHTVPVFPDSDSDGTADPVVRSVDENTASGVVGAAITATDGDGDTLTYSVAATADGDAAAHLTAFNQHFDLDDGSGQISVKAGAVINFEARESYKVLYRVSDGEDASGAADAVIDDMLTLTVTVTNVDEPGVVTIGGTPAGGREVSTATLTDPDGSVSAEMWSWSKSATAGGTFTTIGGATDASYTPAAADVGMFLKASVTYTDNVHSATGQTASGTTTSAVPHTAPRFALDLGRLQVDSTGMASTDSIDRETESLVQAFTTGGKPSDEFVLRRVRLYTAVASGQSINEVAVWSNDPNVFRMSDGVPLAALADGVLSGPDSFDDDLASAEVFESASGVRLAGGTKYWLVVSKQEKADLRIRIPYLAASGVVTDSQTGWSLGQTAFDNENSQPWEYITGIHPWRMQIVTFPARSVPENAASGDAVVGGAITTTDADGDTLTYSVVATDASDGGADLTAFNRDFALNTGTGLISVKATGAMIDYETRSSYTVLYQVSDGENASGTADTTVDDTVTVTVTVTNVDEPGVVTFDGMPQVDVVLTATLTDPDGSVSAEDVVVVEVGHRGRYVHYDRRCHGCVLHTGRG